METVLAVKPTFQLAQLRKSLEQNTVLVSWEDPFQKLGGGGKVGSGWAGI
jgi:hypothetical protein